MSELLPIAGILGQTVRRGSGTWADIGDTRRCCVRPARRCGPSSRTAGTASGAPVDVDLSAVVVLAGRAPHGLGRVLGADGVDPSVRTPSPMSSTRSAQIARHWRPGGCCPGAAGGCGAGRGPRRGRRCRPRQDLLVHQEVADRAGLREIRRQARSGSASGRSGSGPSRPRISSRRPGPTRSHRMRPAGRRTTSRAGRSGTVTSRSRTAPTGAGTPRPRGARRTCR